MHQVVLDAEVVVIDLAPPWICHMLIVFLAGFILAKVLPFRLSAILLSYVAGIVAIWAFGRLELHPGGWMAGHLYWHLASQLFRRRMLRKYPLKVLGAVAFCWIAPILIAWLTVWWRTRSRVNDVEPQS